MQKKIYWPMIVFSLFIFGIAGVSEAEEISNYSNCEVCPGSIHYTPEETVKFIGAELSTTLVNLGKLTPKVVKIDLDGVRPNGNEKDDDAKGYDLRIQGSRNIIYAFSISDGSYLQIVTDLPEIYLQAAEKNKIELKDPEKKAWKKFRASGIFKWLTSGKTDANFQAALKEKIGYILKTLK